MPQDPQDIPDATLRLILASGLGPKTLARLRQHFGGDDEAVTNASLAELARVERIGEKTAAAIRRSIDDANPADEREAMIACGAQMILPGDEDYPNLLAAIPDPPAALWIRGELTSADDLALAVVGSRRCTPYGREQAARFAQNLAQAGLTIVSGGAFGIDAEAHRGALRTGGRTIAVMGCGLSRTYPPKHEDLFEQIVERGGALLSEYPMRAEPLGEHFPRRNRIISGLSLGVLVIEAAQRSGALITARKAIDDHGREVMALPGRLDSPASLGCLGAIRDGWAALVLDHADVLAQLDSARHLLQGAHAGAPEEEKVATNGSANGRQAASLFEQALTPGQEAIVTALRERNETVELNHLAALTQLPMHQLMAELTLLEIRGTVRKDGNGVRVRS